MTQALLKRTEGQLRVRGEMEDLEQKLRDGVKEGEMEQTIFDGGTEEGDAQCSHYFADGVYARSLLIPTGTAVVGRIHKQARICIIAQGRCSFTDEFHRETVEAPWVGEFKAGTKTCVYAHTDTLWIACLGTDLKDPITAFDELTEATHEEYAEAFPEQQRKLI